MIVKYILITYMLNNKSLPLRTYSKRKTHGVKDTPSLGQVQLFQLWGFSHVGVQGDSMKMRFNLSYDFSCTLPCCHFATLPLSTCFPGSSNLFTCRDIQYKYPPRICLTVWGQQWSAYFLYWEFYPLHKDAFIGEFVC